jgi:hypothetical protein
LFCRDSVASRFRTTKTHSLGSGKARLISYRHKPGLFRQPIVRVPVFFRIDPPRQSSHSLKCRLSGAQCLVSSSRSSSLGRPKSPRHLRKGLCYRLNQEILHSGGGRWLTGFVKGSRAVWCGTNDTVWAKHISARIGLFSA